jgi:hypothetical protein
MTLPNRGDVWQHRCGVKQCCANAGLSNARASPCFAYALRYQALPRRCHASLNRSCAVRFLCGSRPCFAVASLSMLCRCQALRGLALADRGRASPAHRSLCHCNASLSIALAAITELCRCNAASCPRVPSRCRSPCLTLLCRDKHHCDQPNRCFAQQCLASLCPRPTPHCAAHAMSLRRNALLCRRLAAIAWQDRAVALLNRTSPAHSLALLCPRDTQQGYDAAEP